MVRLRTTYRATQTTTVAATEPAETQRPSITRSVVKDLPITSASNVSAAAVVLPASAISRKLIDSVRSRCLDTPAQT